MRVTRSGDCGNSPKNTLLEDLTIALARGDGEQVAALTTDDVSWKRPGQPASQGRDAISAAVESVRPKSKDALKILHVVSHGRAGAVSGEFARAGQAIEEFCHVFTFANARGTAVDSITTYRHG